MSASNQTEMVNWVFGEILGRYWTSVLDPTNEEGYTSTFDLDRFQNDFDTLGPYEFAKQNAALFDGSGEEIALKTMSFINKHRGHPVY